MNNLVTFFGRADLNNKCVSTVDFVVFLQDITNIIDGEYLCGMAAFSQYGLVAVTVNKTPIVRAYSVVSLQGVVINKAGSNSFDLSVIGLNNTKVIVRCNGGKVCSRGTRVSVEGRLEAGNCVRILKLSVFKRKTKLHLLSNLFTALHLNKRSFATICSLVVTATVLLSAFTYNPSNIISRGVNMQESDTLVEQNVRITSNRSTVVIEPSNDEDSVNNLVRAYETYAGMYGSNEMPSLKEMVSSGGNLSLSTLVDVPMYASGSIEGEYLVEESVEQSREERALELQDKREVASFMAGWSKDPNMQNRSFSYTEEDITMMANMLYGEAGGCSVEEQRLVIWCVFNRINSNRYGDTISGVIVPYLQFVGYKEGNPIRDDLVQLIKEEWAKWQAGECAPVYAPYATSSDYLYFNGDGEHNWFRAVFTDPIGW